MKYTRRACEEKGDIVNRKGRWRAANPSVMGWRSEVDRSVGGVDRGKEGIRALLKPCQRRIELTNPKLQHEPVVGVFRSHQINPCIKARDHVLARMPLSDDQFAEGRRALTTSKEELGEKFEPKITAMPNRRDEPLREGSLPGIG